MTAALYEQLSESSSKSIVAATHKVTANKGWAECEYHLQAKVPSLQHKSRRMMLATPGGVGANDGVMQPGHKGP